MSTRPFSSKQGDIFLCEIHKQKRLDAGDALGVPSSAAAYMLGILPWPTGEEPCLDCLISKNMGEGFEQVDQPGEVHDEAG